MAGIARLTPLPGSLESEPGSLASLRQGTGQPAGRTLLWDSANHLQTLLRFVSLWRSEGHECQRKSRAEGESSANDYGEHGIYKSITRAAPGRCCRLFPACCTLLPASNCWNCATYAVAWASWRRDGRFRTFVEFSHLKTVIEESSFRVRSGIDAAAQSLRARFQQYSD
jgi:hypothetical protein